MHVSFSSTLDNFARITVVSEIEERETFLLEMRDLGQSKPYEARIKGEISEVPTPCICFCRPQSAHDQHYHTA
jgi:hypothetical protein